MEVCSEMSGISSRLALTATDLTWGHSGTALAALSLGRVLLRLRLELRFTLKSRLRLELSLR